MPTMLSRQAAREDLQASEMFGAFLSNKGAPWFRRPTETASQRISSFALHNIDGNIHNNDIDNIAVVEIEEHR